MRCPACGYCNKEITYIELFTSRGLDDRWLKCKGCGGFFLAKELEEQAESLHASSTSYGTEKAGKMLNIYKRRMFDYVLKQIKEYTPGAKTLIDIGSSYGGFLFLAKQHGFEVSGTDIVPKAVEYMQKNGVKAYRCFSIEELPMDVRYDVISALDCNMYWPNQPKELDEIYLRLKPRGTFAFRVIDKSWTIRLGLIIKKVSPKLGNKIVRRSINDHRSSMPFSALKKLLTERGFDIKKVSILGALHSYNTSLPVKISFWLGNIIYKVTGLFLAPGAVIILKKE